MNEVALTLTQFLVIVHIIIKANELITYQFVIPIERSLPISSNIYIKIRANFKALKLRLYHKVFQAKVSPSRTWPQVNQ